MGFPGEIFAFAGMVILISASGVMSPGPLFAANISYGLNQGAKAGIKMAYGHTIVELPLIILLGVGILSLESFPQYRIVIAVLGALGLFAFAGIQIRTIFNQKQKSILDLKHGAFLAGILFSGLNPFFLIWWFTIGLKLISDSLALWSFAGIGILFAFHIWMYFVWLGAIAFIDSKSKNLLTNRNYRILIIGLSGVLVYFGITFLMEGFQPQSTISI